MNTASSSSLPEPPVFRQALASQVRLAQGQYVVGRVLGDPGGFGITYLADDVHLALEVAIKEYLPRELAARDRDGCTVVPHSPADQDLFEAGLEAFVDEARRLARFNHPNIARVRTFFRDFGTAYLVMDYYRGRTLQAYLEEQGGRLPERQALELMMPILDALNEVHREGMIHRDVKPQNIYLTDDGRPILLDFGAARVTLGERSRDPTRFVSCGFTAPEQYSGEPFRQGPWTDVYATAATLYRMVTGCEPPDALARTAGRPLPELKEQAPHLSTGFCRVLEVALAVVPEDRPHDMADLQRQLRRGERGDFQPGPATTEAGASWQDATVQVASQPI